MKIKTFKIILPILIIVVLLACLLGIVIKANHYNPMEIPNETACPNRNYFDLQAHLQGKDIKNIKDVFPYKLYLDSADLCNIPSIEKDIAGMNIINPGDKMLNQEVLSIALTSKLEANMIHGYENSSLDSLIVLFRWSEKFNNYKDIDTVNSMLFASISDYWINFISNKLGQYATKDPKIKYEFKFRYLAAVCESKMYQPAIGNSNSEKVVLYIIDKDWGHLSERFWYGTSGLFKSLILIAILITLYGYFCIVINIFNKIKSSKK